jgi:CRP-like cAMP-binding protein
VTDGEVEVRRHVTGAGPVALRRLGAGECFGEIALVSDRARTATVRAVVPTNVLAVDRDAFQALFSTLPPLRGFVETLIADRDR